MLRTWSRSKGLLTTEFKFIKFLPAPGDTLVIDVESTGGTRAIAKDEVKRVFLLWDRYRDGTLARHKLNLGMNSSHIIGILHWLDAQAEQLGIWP